jgi:hypothetical protein
MGLQPAKPLLLVCIFTVCTVYQDVKHLAFLIFFSKSSIALSFITMLAEIGFFKEDALGFQNTVKM